MTNMIIFVGGPTACGKTTFTTLLNEKIEKSIRYRRYQAFFDIANKQGIPESEVFNQISSEAVDDWFVSVCKELGCVISDVHYAVQLGRNNNTNNNEIDIYREYVPTISKELLEKLFESNIKVIAIYLTCAPQVCLKRAINRYNKKEKELRIRSLVDAKLESIAEKNEWDNIISFPNVEHLELNTELFTTEELVNKTLSYLSDNMKKDLQYLVLKRKINNR